LSISLYIPSVYRRGVRLELKRRGLGIRLFIIAVAAFAGVFVLGLFLLLCTLGSLLLLVFLLVFHRFITSGLVWVKNRPLAAEKSAKIAKSMVY
jgi:hypothetical protein